MLCAIKSGNSVNATATFTYILIIALNVKGFNSSNERYRVANYIHMRACVPHKHTC